MYCTVRNGTGHPCSEIDGSSTDYSRRNKGDLARGELKSIQIARIVLVQAPPEEQATIRWNYRAFVEDEKLERGIVDLLNGRGIRTQRASGT